MSRTRLFFTGIALFLLIGVGVIWILSNQGTIQNSWAPSFGITFSVLGVLVAFAQWLLPLSSSETKISVTSAESSQAQGILLKQIHDRLTGENGVLVVYEKKKNVGKNIRVSHHPREGFEEIEANIVDRTANGQPLFAAIFSGLKPDRYFVDGITWQERQHITVSPGQIIELDWRRDLNKEKKEAEQQQRFLIDLRVSSFIIGLGGVLFLVHKYLMISNLDSIGIIAIGLGAINLLSLFFMNWLGWLEVDHFLKRLFIFTIELGGVLFIAHRYISIPYLDIAGIVILALGVVCLSFYIFAELAGI